MEHGGVLVAKEARYGWQQQLIRESGAVVVQVSLNTPGGFSLYPWEELIAEARSAVLSMLATLGFAITMELRLVDALGPCHLLAVSGDGQNLKRHCIALEETSPRGRLWDIDVFIQSGAVDRPLLSLKGRMCWVCGQEEAHVCRRRGAHTADEVIAVAKKIAVGGQRTHGGKN